MQSLQVEARKIATQFISQEIKRGKLWWFDRSMNLDHERKLYFVHNPKCMGTSLKGWLGLRTDHADHRFPSLVVNKALWEQYTTVVVVRHPIDRFLSSYHFHCKSDYEGTYTRRHADLKSWDMDRYFEMMRINEPHCLAPQWKYAVHLKSEYRSDFLIRMEDPGMELARLAEHLKIPLTIPLMNKGTAKKELPSPQLLNKLAQYYEYDFQHFGYEL